MKKLVYIVSFLFAATGAAKAQDAILGAGASFPYPLYSKMFSEYNKATNVKVNYQSIGSGGGIKSLTEKTIEFGASDAVMNDEQIAKLSAPVLHIPMTAGAIVVCYNLPNVKKLNLTGAVLADIFLGKITKWNDARIAAVNKGVALPATSIVIAHRSDGSGTSNNFTTYLDKVSEEWHTKVGKGNAVSWPVGLGGKGNEGVAGLVKQTPGCIGYIELAYAIQNNISFATLENKNHKWIVPSVQSTTAAANMNIPEDGKVSLVNTDAKDGYPISSFSWVLIYKEQNYGGRTPAQAKALLKMLWWMIHDGQKYSTDLTYSPLPKAAVKVSEKILKSATYSGKPIL